jgi:hypothetical protein
LFIVFLLLEVPKDIFFFYKLTRFTKQQLLQSDVTEEEGPKAEHPKERQSLIIVNNNQHKTHNHSEESSFQTNTSAISYQNKEMFTKYRCYKQPHGDGKVSPSGFQCVNGFACTDYITNITAAGAEYVKSQHHI